MKNKKVKIISLICLLCISFVVISNATSSLIDLHGYCSATAISPYARKVQLYAETEATPEQYVKEVTLVGYYYVNGTKEDSFYDKDYSGFTSYSSNYTGEKWDIIEISSSHMAKDINLDYEDQIHDTDEYFIKY